MAEIDKLRSHSSDELLRELRVREEIRSSGALRGLDATATEPSEALQDFDSATIAEFLKNEQKVIYGVDDRQDLFSITDPELLDDADCVVSLFQRTSITDNGNGTSTLTTQNFGGSLIYATMKYSEISQ